VIPGAVEIVFVKEAVSIRGERGKRLTRNDKECARMIWRAVVAEKRCGFVRLERGERLERRMRDGSADLGRRVRLNLQILREKEGVSGTNFRGGIREGILLKFWGGKKKGGKQSVKNFYD
jgi:hypothetical protein